MAAQEHVHNGQEPPLWIGGRDADLSTFTQDELNVIAAKLNHRPRRVLSWATPAEAFGTTEPKPLQLAPA